MKKYSLFSLILLLLPINIILAQSTDLIPQIAVETVNISQEQYQAGETVTGQFTLWNMGDIDATDIDYRIILAGEYQPGGIPEIEYDYRQVDSSTFLQPGFKKEIQFEYTLPPNVSGENLGLSIIAYSGPHMLGWNHRLFDIIPSENSQSLANINIQGAFLTKGEIEIGLEEGFVLPEEGLEFNATLRNINNTQAELIPHVELYKFDNLNDQISEQSLPNFNISLPQQTYKTILNFTDLDPGVYVAKFYFTQNDNQVSNPVQIRFMVDGAVATLLDANVDKYSVNKNETFTLNINYAGSPRNPETMELLGGGEEATLVYVLRNEKGETVAEGQKPHFP